MHGLKGVHIGNFGYVNPVHCLGVLSLKTVYVLPQVQGLGEGITMETGHVTPGIGSGRGSLWRLWMCEPRCRVWEVGSLWELLTGYPRCMVWERVTL